MSDRLAIAASMSVLTMAIYVLFGAEAVRMPIDGNTFDSPAAMSLPSAVSVGTGNQINLLR